MSESNPPVLYSFNTVDRDFVEALIEAFRAVLRRPGLPTRDIHLSAIMLRGLERLPLVTDGIGLTVSLKDTSADGNDWVSMDMTLDDESFRISEFESHNEEGFGRDHFSRELVEIGVGWRGGQVEMTDLGEWIAMFASRAASPAVELSFEDFGESEVNWADETTGDAYWSELDSDDS